MLRRSARQNRADSGPAVQDAGLVPHAFRLPLLEPSYPMKFVLLASSAFACILSSAVHAQSTGAITDKPVEVNPLDLVKPTYPPSSYIPPPAPLVPGADSCVTPDLVVGNGPHSWSNVGMTTGTEGQNNLNCS